jgi:hypothetical protein
MSSIDPRAPFAISYRRGEVAAFWFLGTALAAATIGIGAAAFGAQRPWTWTAAAALVLVLPGALWTPWFEAGVWAWNGCVRRIAAALRQFVLIVSYYTLMVAVGRSGAGLELRRGEPQGSRWVARAGAAVREVDFAATARPGAAAWGRALRTFAAGSGRTWTFCLWPVLFTLALLADEHEQNVPPGSTYTLY